MRMRGPGFEPESSAWKAEILAVELPALKQNYINNPLINFSTKNFSF